MKRMAIVAGVCLMLGFGAGVLVTLRTRETVPAELAGRGSTLIGEHGRPAGAPGARDESERREVAGTELVRHAAKAPPKLVALPTAAVDERPRRLTLDQVPGPVRDVVSNFVAGRHVGKLNFETRLRKGEVHYRLDAHLDGIDHNMVFDERGTLRDSDIDVAASDLSPRAQQAIQRVQPGASVLKAKKKEGTDWPVPVYEVEIAVGGAHRELRVTDAGDVLRDRVK